MHEAEGRLPCPVCLGIKMSKLPLAQKNNLLLDQCERCGGMWFDADEVKKLRLLRPKIRWRKAVLSTDAYSMTCHGCHAVMDRNAARCPACERDNVLDCPVCDRSMERRQVQGLHLDFCRSCQGVWFDRIELAEIWNLNVDKVKARGTAVAWQAGDAVSVGAEVADFMLWNPDIAAAGARAIGHSVEAVASVTSTIANTGPETIGTMIEATGELAGAVFEAIADIVGGILN